MMNRLLLFLRSWFIPMRATLDGSDNSVTVNKSLYKALLQAGIAEPGCNRIFAFRIGKGRYGFSVNPQQIQDVDTITSELQVNPQVHSIGFEMRCPSVQMLFNDWLVSPTTVAKCRVTFHVMHGVNYFLIHKPNANGCEMHVNNVYSRYHEA